MGKKHIIAKTEEELIKEGEVIEKAIQKDAKLDKVIIGKEGRIYIFCSYNNTIISLTDSGGNVLASQSAGRLGFKGTKKSTPFAASKVAEAISQLAEKMGIKRIHIIVKGVGSGRESALRSIANQNFEILSIQDATPIPHNGCKPRKPRRL
ncbi:MAG TPA: 30S ribosomal protein S11 [Candidatus Pacearchaeota archaeon]|jgi:small subunit ribosomal protein S11|nr:30S ribosomal protein S11 [Candidatus Pacearchaeota archaeon]HRR95053.1 30S ribosomal protein S11 [Candidatus Paceibacterota bacterium]HQG09421.1 30S ribosomal protein S11 [Candidatus Pacearchaeota archaeon]HQH20178.1 30S ribosomal protein S11 [Candidatus Pacearchaeota archaeon]HQK58474.1 30S ribosomal protein S11 [Candidatus Pacearchaeota archaeon]